MSPEQSEKNETFLDMKAAARLVPSQPSSAAVWRWCRKGVLARDGQRIRLEHQRYGRRLYTTRAALEAFAKAVAEADQEQLAPPAAFKPDIHKHRGDQQRYTDAEAAAKRLAEEGF